MTVTYRDRGLKKILQDMQHFAKGNVYARAGVIGKTANATEHAETGLTNALLATIHEYGVPDKGIPARSFILAPFEAGKKAYHTMLAALSRRAYNLQLPWRKALDTVALKMASDQKTWVTGGKVEPPQSEATAERKRKKTYKGAAKGDPKTLIDSGALVNSISHDVVGE